MDPILFDFPIEITFTIDYIYIVETYIYTHM